MFPSVCSSCGGIEKFHSALFFVVLTWILDQIFFSVVCIGIHGLASSFHYSIFVLVPYNVYACGMHANLGMSAKAKFLRSLHFLHVWIGVINKVYPMTFSFASKLSLSNHVIVYWSQWNWKFDYQNPVIDVWNMSVCVMISDHGKFQNMWQFLWCYWNENIHCPSQESNPCRLTLVDKFAWSEPSSALTRGATGCHNQLF